MLITTGKVKDGTIEFDAETLPEGATVTLLAAEGDEHFELAPVEEAMLLAAIEEAERGGTITASRLLRRIRKS